MPSVQNKTQHRNALDLLLIAGLFSLVFVLSLRRLADYDLWGHLKAGEYLFKNGSILTTHYFNCSWPEFPYVNHEWLFQAITYRLYSFGGEALLVSLQVFLMLVSFWLLFRTARFYSNTIALIVLILGIGMMASAHRVILRPQHFSYVFLLTHLYCLHQYARGKTGYLFLLPLTMLFWVNIHAESLWGVAVPGMFLFVEGVISVKQKERRGPLKKLAVVYCLLLLASLVNPFTYKTVLWPLLVMSEQFAGVDELLPPLAWKYLFFWVYFGLFLAALPFAFRKVGIHFLLIACFFAPVAWMANRGIPHFVFASAPLIVAAADSLVSRFRKEKVIAVLRPLVLAGLVLVLFLILTDRRYLRKFDNLPYPEGAVGFIQKNRLEGNMFNLHTWGGYLVWELYPSVRTYIDNRFFHRKFFEEYEMIYSGGISWQELLDRYEITMVLLDYSTSDRPNLRDLLFRSTNWNLVYWDDTSLLYLKRVPDFKAVTGEYAFRILNPDTGRFNPQQLDREVLPAALQEAEKDLGNAGHSWKAWLFKGNILYSLGRAEQAVQSFQKALSLAPDPVSSIYFNLGQAYMAMGRLDEAEKEFLRVADLSPGLQVYEALWRIYVLQGRKAEAESVYGKHLKGRL